tara:strand:+ start:913 stop:1392 length:480 start_codon:yes stop_codon:yes gene_type:complete
LGIKISSGKLKISSGKGKITSPPEVRVIINHRNNGGNPLVARYSLGLTNTVSYSSGYLLRGEATIPDDGSTYELDLGYAYIPEAIPGDGTVDCYLYIEHGGEVEGETPFVDGISGFSGSDLEDTTPGTSNGRLELKLSASPATNKLWLIEEELVEWDFL